MLEFHPRARTAANVERIPVVLWATLQRVGAIHRMCVLKLMEVQASKSELLGWVKRFQVAERRSKQETLAEPLPPDESFSKALELMQIADDCGMPRPNPYPNDEDLMVLASWNRLRKALGVPHGTQ